LKVVVVGGGFGGTEVIHQLVLRGAKNLEIELISNKKFFENTIGGTELISEKTKLEELTYDLKELSDYWDYNLVIGTVENIDLKTKTFKVGNREEKYDVLIVATGSEPNFFHVPGANLSQSAYHLSDFIDINRKLKELEVDHPHVVIAGGGFVGIEVAAEILDLYDALKKKAVLAVIEKMPTVLPAYNNLLARKTVFEDFSSRGVKFILDNGIRTVKNDGLVLDDGAVVQSDLTVWTAGVKGCLIQSQIPGGNLIRGCVDVDEKLLVKGYENAFAIGDSASVLINGKEATKMAGEAMEQAKTVAKNIVLISHGQKPKIQHIPNYTTDYPKALLSMGKGKAMLIFGPQFASVGSTEYFLKKRIDVEEIMGRFPQ
jgi:NADH dehydrogenase